MADGRGGVAAIVGGLGHGAVGDVDHVVIGQLDSEVRSIFIHTDNGSGRLFACGKLKFHIVDGDAIAEGCASSQR